MATTTTTVFLSNLHCASCVRTINDTLFALTPTPVLVDVSIVYQSVTVEHHPTLSAGVIKAALEDAGFDLPTESIDAASHPLGGFTAFLSGKGSKHVQQCSLCQHAACIPEQSSSVQLGDSEDQDSLFKAKHQLPDITQSSTPSPPEVDDTPQRITLSVGGMTCSSCVATITERVSRLPGVSDIVVGLLSNSATVHVENKSVISTVTSAGQVAAVGPRMISEE